MNFHAISHSRLAGQQIAGSKFNTVKDLVGWMGAMQAQDFSMAKWAVGVRVPGATDTAIQESFNKGEILRTHLLRPTWHLVSADDIYWILELTAPHINASLKTRRKELGLTAAIFNKSISAIEKALASDRYLTRDEIAGALEKSKIPMDSSRLYHLLLMAELHGILCSGPMKAKKHTYALLAHRVPKKKTLSRPQALAELARRYFTSHGPATLQDFAWWSGLAAKDIKTAVQAAGSDLVSEIAGAQTYWFHKSFSCPKIEKGSVFLLPAFDEFLISYRDRSPSITSEDHGKAVSTNGVFRPFLVWNGQVTGLWKRTAKKNKTIVETQLFQPAARSTKQRVEKQIAAYGQFLNQTTEIIWG